MRNTSPTIWVRVKITLEDGEHFDFTLSYGRSHIWTQTMTNKTYILQAIKCLMIAEECDAYKITIAAE